MNAIIIGLGSMGRRRARLLHRIDESIQIVGIDTQENRRQQAERELGISTASTIKEACEIYKPDIAFVSTSPLSHAKIITECLKNNLHVFTELNLVDTGYDENMKLALKNGKVLFLSSTFLYRKEIQYIKNAVKKCNCKLSYMYHAGQYLPDWHPWESYKSFFVGDKQTNGCREFMAIEFPWMMDVFGEIKTVHVLSSKDSKLEIDFPDTYQIMLEHETGHRGLIKIDIVTRKAVRTFELSGEDLYLTWDGTPDSLMVYDIDRHEDQNILIYGSVEKRPEYSSFIIEDAYLSEILNFLHVIKGEEDAKYSFMKDKKVLSIINDIENGKRG